MQVTATAIPDVLLMEPKVFGDERGFFFESFSKRVWQEKTGILREFVQDNHSRSCCGVLRGLHYQIRQAQGKLVRVISGELFDVAVDVRRSSPTFGKWVGEYLSAQNKRQLWVPPGFAHGIYITSEWAEIIYKTTDFYAPEWERTIQWDDPDLAIDWPLSGSAPILSAKDMLGTPFQTAEVFD